MYKAHINSFGDLVIDGPEGSVSYPTEFTRMVALSSSHPKSNRKNKSYYIIGILETSGECVIHQVEEMLSLCVNAHRFTVIGQTHPGKAKRRDVFVSRRKQRPVLNKYITHRVPHEIPVDSVRSNEETMLEEYWNMTEPFFRSLI